MEITDGKDRPEEKADLPAFVDSDTEEMVGETEPMEETVSMGQGSVSGEEISHQPRVIIAANSLQGTDLSAGSSMPWSVSVKTAAAASHWKI